MVHGYYGIYDSVAKCYCYIGESKSNETFARMCNIMEKDLWNLRQRSKMLLLHRRKQKQRNLCTNVQYHGKG
nr:MAG TPA: hypothetical protein [Microviridae sp.]